MSEHITEKNTYSIDNEIKEKIIGKDNWTKIYTTCCIFTVLELLLIWFYDKNICKSLFTLLTGTALLILIGAYFCIFIKERLPQYYDEYKVNAYNDGFMRIFLPGVSFNNNNWPYIVKSGRMWVCAALIVQPVLTFLVYILLPIAQKPFANFVILPVTLGMFVPMIYSAYKYQ